MKSNIFWDVTPCSSLSFNRRFGETYLLHLQCRLFCLPPACLLVFCWTYFFDPEDGGDMFLRSVGWNSTDYTASNPTRLYSPRCNSFELGIPTSKHEIRTYQKLIPYLYAVKRTVWIRFKTHMCKDITTLMLIIHRNFKFFGFDLCELQ
jgi:hypothetical protein